MLDCDMINIQMDKFALCERRQDGLFMTTNCLYPSFEQVGVYIVGHGDGYIVHDNADAARLAWTYGIDERSFKRLAAHSAQIYGCEASGLQIQCGAHSKDWLWSAISTVANASADAAKTAVVKARLAKEVSLVTRAKAVFDRSKWKPETKLDYHYPGVSGKMHTFDLAVVADGSTALIDAVTPHHNSIAAKYLAFSDTASQPGIYKYALYEGDLSAEDKSLLANVADLVNYKALEGTDGRFILQ
jgi:hypothetical protein